MTDDHPAPEEIDRPFPRVRPARWRRLPPRPRPEELVTGHRDPAVPGSVLTASDAQREFMIRHAG